MYALRPYLTGREKRGFLVAFEGPDGSGKSTQFKLLKQQLSAQGRDVVATKWKSAPVLAPIIKSRKQAQALSTEEYCLLHAADFLSRLENTIIPALNQGKIVLCDRYVFTCLTRDVVRGVSKDWIMRLLDPIVWPDLIFYFSVSPETSLQRIGGSRQPTYYEAGQDVTQIANPWESFNVFIRAVIEAYDELSQEFNFVRVDAEQSIEAQHAYVSACVQEKFEGRCELYGQETAGPALLQARAY
jgi:dTMP kinase